MANYTKNTIKDWEEEDKLTLITGWARSGLTDEEISHNMGIAYKTLCNWKSKSSIILQALKKGKEVADYIVEDALYKNATGYTVKLKKPIKVKTVKQIEGKKIEEEKIEYADEEVYIRPETIAQIFWLKNRKPKQWREKTETDIKVNNGIITDLIGALNNAKGNKSKST